MAVSALTNVVKMSGMKIDTKEHQNILNKLLKAGVLAEVIGVFLILFLLYKIFFRKKKSRLND